jgi:hypothetical protein
LACLDGAREFIRPVAKDRAGVRRGSVAALALVGAAACVLLMGCTWLDGPLQFGPDEGMICAPTPEFEDAAFGVNLPDDLTSSITIDSIVLVDEKNAVLGKTSLMLFPPGPGLRLGLDQYPPTKQFPTNWSKAKPAIGTATEPGTAYELVLEVRSDGTNPARFSGVVVTYTSAGRQFLAQTHFGLELKKAASCAG